MEGLAGLDSLSPLYNGTPWVSTEAEPDKDGVVLTNFPETVVPPSYLEGLNPVGPRTLARAGKITKSPQGWVLGYSTQRTNAQIDAYDVFNNDHRSQYSTSLRYGAAREREQGQGGTNWSPRLWVSIAAEPLSGPTSGYNPGN